MSPYSATVLWLVVWLGLYLTLFCEMVARILETKQSSYSSKVKMKERIVVYGIFLRGPAGEY